MQLSTKWIVGLLSIISLVAVGMVLQVAQGVFLPLLIAWLLSHILAPVMTFLTRLKIPLGFSILVVLILLMGLCILGITFINARLMAFAAVYPKYQAQFEYIFNSITQHYDLTYNPLSSINWGDQVRSFLLASSGYFVRFSSKLVLVFVFLVFILLGRPFSQYKIRAAFNGEQADKILTIGSSISVQIGRYLVIQFVISAVTGICVWLALRFLSIDFAITWGTLAFVLNFVPTVGSIAASVPPILLALIQYYPNYWMAAGCALVLLTIQMIIGNVITPKIMGDKLNLSPVVILMSLLFFGWLWGPTGALLSVIIASAVRITCENIEPLYPIGILMGSGKKLSKQA
ncbi:MAG: AI-2E family transporter [Spartobacteria bacterium]|nr:AI-2E family transporter [Spartobacteria bacterium]